MVQNAGNATWAPDLFFNNGGIFGTGFRIVKPPDIFYPTFTPDKKVLLWHVGDSPQNKVLRSKVSYRIYFTPIDLASPNRISSPFGAFNAFQKGKQVGSADAALNGSEVTIDTSAYAGLDGWFFATAVNVLNVESAPTVPHRNPIVGGNDTRVAPDVLTPTAIVRSAGLDPWGRQLLRVDLAANVPYQTNGVSTIEMENGGQGYTHDFPVTFTNRTGDTTGAGAYGIANTQDGVVLGVTITQAGAGYTLEPVVHFDFPDNPDAIGAGARAHLTTLGSFSGMQLYFFNYFESGDFSEGPVITAPTFGSMAAKPGGLIHDHLTLYPDSPPTHDMKIYFVSLSQTGTRRNDPFNSPFVDFPTGLHL